MASQIAGGDEQAADGQVGPPRRRMDVGQRSTSSRGLRRRTGRSWSRAGSVELGHRLVPSTGRRLGAYAGRRSDAAPPTGSRYRGSALSALEPPGRRVGTGRDATMASCRTSPSRARCHARAAGVPRSSPSRSSAVDVATPDIIEAAGIRWIHIESPRTADRDWLEEQFDFHPLDYEDVYSRNNRPKLDQYDDYVFIVLHFPMFEKETGRILTAELDLFMGPDYLITLPNIPLPPLTAMFERYREKRGPARGDLLEGHRLPALQDRRHLRRRVVPDAPQDGGQARPHRGRHLRGSLVGDRPRHLRGEAGDHQLPADRPAAARRPARPRADQAALPPGRARDLLRRHLATPPSGSGTPSRTTRRSSRRLESTNESVLSHRLNDSFRILTAASVVLLPLTLDREHLRHERAGPRAGRGVRLPRDHDHDGACC